MLTDTTYEIARLRMEDLRREARHHNDHARALRAAQRWPRRHRPVTEPTRPDSLREEPAMDTALLLIELGERVAEDGPAAHDPMLLEVSDLAAAAAPAAAAVLADRTAPPVVRARALAVATAALLRTAASRGADVTDARAAA